MTGLDYAYFIVYASGEKILITMKIEYDAGFCLEMSKKLKEFYFKFYLPEITT